MDITVNDPADVDKVDPPIYEGPANKAHEKLDDYIYLTDITDRALVVTGGASFLIAIADDIDHIPAVNRRIGLVDTSAPIANGREFRAMATVETAERYAVRALAILQDGADADAVTHARVLLSALIDLTSGQTANEVRNQEDSDAISADASRQIRRAIDQLDPAHRALAESYSRVTGRYER